MVIRGIYNFNSTTPFRFLRSGADGRIAIKWGLAVEIRRTEYANTDVKIEEADRNNEAQSAQTKTRQADNLRIFDKVSG